MGRPRGFDEAAVVAATTKLICTTGYEATSIDDLVEVTGLHRGSLYKAFGSKRGIFLAALREYVQHGLPALVAAGKDMVDGDGLDLLLIATLELSPRDREVRSLVDGACALLTPPAGRTDSDAASILLGQRMLRRAGLDVVPPDEMREAKSDDQN